MKLPPGYGKLANELQNSIPIRRIAIVIELLEFKKKCSNQNKTRNWGQNKRKYLLKAKYLIVIAHGNLIVFISIRMSLCSLRRIEYIVVCNSMCVL